MTLDRISTLLFVPGNQPARFEKALASGADGIMAWTPQNSGPPTLHRLV
jgi:hypothetical protein